MSGYAACPDCGGTRIEYVVDFELDSGIKHTNAEWKCRDSECGWSESA